MCPPPSRRHAPSPSPQLPLRAPAAVFRARPGMAGLGLRAPHRPPRLGPLAPAPPPPPPPPPQGSGLPAASTWLPRGQGRTGLPAPSPAVRPHRVPTEAPRPPRPPSRGCGSRRSPEPLREARGGVCVMGRGLGNGGAAWEGPLEPGSPAPTQAAASPASSPSLISSRAPVPTRPLPNRTKLRSQEPSHAASEPHKRRENGGQGPTEIAEGAGAHGAARGGGKSRARGRPAAGDERRGTGTGGVGASAVGCLRLPARLLPPSETSLLQWLAGRPGFLSVGGTSGTACSLHRVCLRLAGTATLLSGRFHFALQPQDALPPPTKTNPRPSPETLHPLSPREKT